MLEEEENEEEHKNNLARKDSEFKKLSLSSELEFRRIKPIRCKVFLMELDEAFMEFLNSFPKRTKQTYIGNIKLFYEFTKMNGKEIIESRKKDSSSFWERKILEMKSWLEQRKYSEHSMKTILATVRSFFNYYRIPLVFTRHEKSRISKAKTRRTRDFPLRLEHIQRMAQVGNLKEKLVLLLGKSLGLRSGDFSRIDFGMLRSLDLNAESPICLKDDGFLTQKEGTYSYPFLDNDAVEVCKLWLELNKDKPDHERILNVKPEELSYILRNLAKRAGIEIGNQNLRFHCLRKFLCDKLSRVTSESRWKQIVGKIISEGSYISSDELREDYKKVLEYTLTKETSGHGKRVEELKAEIETLKERIKIRDEITLVFQDILEKIGQQAPNKEQIEPLFVKLRDQIEKLTREGYYVLLEPRQTAMTVVQMGEKGRKYLKAREEELKKEEERKHAKM